MTTQTYVGNITDKDGPVLRFTQSGKAVASFNLAVNTRSKRGDEYVDDPPLFLRVNAWDSLAENLVESFGKGDRVIVVGRQRMTEYTDREGNLRQQLEVTAEEVGASVRYATASPSKVRRDSQPSPQGEQWNAPQGDPFSADGPPPF